MTDSEGPGTSDEPSSSFRTGLLPTLVLGLATLLTAWAFFQDSEWQRERFRLSDESLGYSEQQADLEREANRLSATDQAVLSEWLVALARGETFTADALILAFRPEVRSQISELAAQSKAEAIESIYSFFESEDYRVNEILAEAEDAAQKAEQAERESREASDNASRYGLTGVILAGALLFAGLTPQLRGNGSTLALLFAIGLLGLGAFRLVFSPVIL
jgi:hypothetical protein